MLSELHVTEEHVDVLEPVQEQRNNAQVNLPVMFAANGYTELHISVRKERKVYFQKL